MQVFNVIFSKHSFNITAYVGLWQLAPVYPITKKSILTKKVFNQKYTFTKKNLFVYFHYIAWKSTNFHRVGLHDGKYDDVHG